MHAHRCQKCAADGKETIWIHPDICRGKVAAHTCPECGTIQWKQCKVESGKLPQQARHEQPQTDFSTVLGYVVLAVGIALLVYGAFLYVKKYQNGKLLNEGCEK